MTLKPFTAEGRFECDRLSSERPGFSKLMERFLKFIYALEPTDTLIKVRSWKPYWDDEMNALAWPTMLIDARGCGRMTVTPIWDRARFRGLLVLKSMRN